MKMMKFVFSKSKWLLFAAILVSQSINAQIFDGDITLASQADVNAFNYIEITGTLTINGEDIDDLSPLSNLTSLGALDINSNTVLADLDGLQNVTSVKGDLVIYDNAALNSFCGLFSLLNENGLIGAFSITNNAENPTIQEIIDNGPCVSLVVTNPTAVCSPATVDLTAASVTEGSTPDLIFTYWIDENATITYNTPMAATSGTYFIKGTDPATGKYDVKPVLVTVNALSNNTSSGFKGGTICEGDPGTLTFNAYNDNLYPYTIGYSLKTDETTIWYKEIPDDSETTFAVEVNPTKTTDYKLVSIENKNGCIRTTGFSKSTARIIVNEAPSAPTVNVVDNLDGTSTLTASDYTGALLWSTNETTSSITVNSGGTYTVIQTVNGCTSSEGSGTVAPTPTTSILSSNKVSCGASDVDVTVQDFVNVGAISLKLNFDPSVLEYQDVDINTAIVDPIYDGNNAIGKFSLSYSGDEINLPDDAVLFTLHFNVLPEISEATTLLSWSQVPADCEYAGPGGVPVYNSTFEDKTIDVFNCSVSGKLTYYNNERTPLNKVELTLNPGNSKVVTDDAGFFSFEGLHDGTYRIEVTGNQKEVGYINSTDAGAANAWGTFGGTIEYVKFLAGDVAENNLFINASDASRIQQFFVDGKSFDRAPWSYWKKGVTIENNYINPKPANFDVLVNGANVVGFDIYGMCTGDFNGSFTPTILKSTHSSLSLISVGNLLVGPEQEFELPLRATSSMRIGAISMILRVSPDLVKVQDVSVNKSSTSVNWVQKDNELRIGWFSPMPVKVTVHENLLTLKLKTLDAFHSGQPIDISLLPDPLNEIADGNFNVIKGAVLEVANVNNLTAGINDNPNKQGLSISNYPNPFSTSTTIMYSLPVDGKVSIVLYNQLQQVVATLVDAGQRAGQYAIKMNNNSLNPGIYYAKLRNSSRNDDKICTTKIIIIK